MFESMDDLILEGDLLSSTSAEHVYLPDSVSFYLYELCHRLGECA